ncbi:MAG: DoxX family protein [Rhodothermales bacterium]|nr:DoxX family protein [Rhodothermales bacterium]
MLQRIISTDDNITLTILRVTLGVVMFAHGAQKLLGWFGGSGFTGTMGWLTGAMGIPYLIALLIIIIESIGALSLIAGFLSRIWALGIGFVMIGAIALVHAQHGFFMNFNGQQAGEGFEYHLLVLAIVAAITVAGGGKASVDLWLHKRSRAQANQAS